jgi:hypothetical protein
LARNPLKGSAGTKTAAEGPAWPQISEAASGLGVAMTREWRRKPLKSLKTDSEMAIRRRAIACEQGSIRRIAYGSVATILAYDARGRWASSGRLAAHAALSNKEPLLIRKCGRIRLSSSAA